MEMTTTDDVHSLYDCCGGLWSEYIHQIRPDWRVRFGSVALAKTAASTAYLRTAHRERNDNPKLIGRI